MRKCICLVICIFIWSSLSKGATDHTITVTDMAGRKVTTPFDPKRIVCLGPGTLRLIVYLKAENKLVGVEDMEKRRSEGRPYWIAHPELSKLPRCGAGGASSINKKPDMEAVLAVSPDVIFVTYMDATLADEVSEKLKIPVVVLSYGELAAFDESVFDSLKIAGKILNREKRAGDVIYYINAMIGDLQLRSNHSRSLGISNDSTPPKNPVVYVGGIGYRGSHGIGSTKQQFIPFEWVQAKNAVDELPDKKSRHLFLDKERLLKLNPDIIFLDGGGLGLVAKDYQKKLEFYNVLSAFKEKKVYTLLPFNYYTTNIDTALVNAYAIGKILYDKGFKDIDLAQKGDEIYRFLVGKPVYQTMREDYAPVGKPASFLGTGEKK